VNVENKMFYDANVKNEVLPTNGAGGAKVVPAQGNLGHEVSGADKSSTNTICRTESQQKMQQKKELDSRLVASISGDANGHGVEGGDSNSTPTPEGLNFPQASHSKEIDSSLVLEYISAEPNMFLLPENKGKLPILAKVKTDVFAFHVALWNVLAHAYAANDNEKKLRALLGKKSLLGKKLGNKIPAGKLDTPDVLELLKTVLGGKGTLKMSDAEKLVRLWWLVGAHKECAIDALKSCDKGTFTSNFLFGAANDMDFFYPCEEPALVEEMIAKGRLAGESAGEQKLAMLEVMYKRVEEGSAGMPSDKNTSPDRRIGKTQVQQHCWWYGKLSECYLDLAKDPTPKKSGGQVAASLNSNGLPQTISERLEGLAAGMYADRKWLDATDGLDSDSDMEPSSLVWGSAFEWVSVVKCALAVYEAFPSDRKSVV
jgi:hypothetical protein